MSQHAVNQNERGREQSQSEEPESPGIIEHRRVEAAYFGPIPPPADLERYEQVLPGAAERILSMAETQSAHRQRLEAKMVDGDNRRAWAGVIIGGLLAGGCIAGGIWLVSIGFAAAGSAIATTTVATLAGVFVYGTRTKQPRARNR